MIMLLGLGLMVFAAVVFRVENPSITVHEEQRSMPGKSGGMGAMGGNGNMSEIAATMQRLQANPEDTDAMRDLGMMFMEMKAWERAATFWDMLVQREPKDVAAINQKGYCLFEMGKFDEAAALFENMLAIDANNMHGHFNLGIIYKHYLSQPEKAKAHFQQVIDGAGNDQQLLDSAKQELSSSAP